MSPSAEMGVIMRKSVLGVALVVIIALAGAYLGSPYWTAQRFRSAAAAGDADRIDAMTDLPAVKDSLKSQLSSAFVRKMNADPSMKGNPFAALGALIVPAVIDKAVDGYVTPDGLASIMKGEKPDGATPGTGTPAHQYAGEGEYIGLDRFRVKLRDTISNEEGPALLFERRGIIDWKLIRIELPPSLFAGQSGLGASEQQSPEAPSSLRDFLREVLASITGSRFVQYCSSLGLHLGGWRFALLIDKT